MAGQENEVTDGIKALKVAYRVADEFRTITRLFYSADAADRRTCEDIIASVDDPKGLYLRVRGSFMDVGARTLFEGLVLSARELDPAVAGLGTADPVSLSEIGRYVGAVRERVSSMEGSVADLSRELEEAQAEVTRLRPYEERWTRVHGELRELPRSAVANLIDSYSSERKGGSKSE